MGKRNIVTMRVHTDMSCEHNVIYSLIFILTPERENALSSEHKHILLTTITSLPHLTLPATPATTLFCYSQSSQTSASLCQWTQRGILIPSSVYFSAVVVCSLYIPPSFRLACQRYK